ncbi:hypothetical protein QBC47DRAFT_358778 [Echria macrotheca]|uniref:Uncharacterized protein n=1 Tax=Echria macrotheca TaxID=438768 RepID=A0AAJ0BFW9_9PEZI|nr:hypothetical protein QBC47DRAFT_358778 [Echria macrotheca]
MDLSALMNAGEGSSAGPRRPGPAESDPVAGPATIPTAEPAAAAAAAAIVAPVSPVARPARQVPAASGEGIHRTWQVQYGKIQKCDFCDARAKEGVIYRCADLACGRQVCGPCVRRTRGRLGNGHALDPNGGILVDMEEEHEAPRPARRRGRPPRRAGGNVGPQVQDPPVPAPAPAPAAAPAPEPAVQEQAQAPVHGSVANTPAAPPAPPAHPPPPMAAHPGAPINPHGFRNSPSHGPLADQRGQFSGPQADLNRVTRLPPIRSILPVAPGQYPSAFPPPPQQQQGFSPPATGQRRRRYDEDEDIEAPEPQRRRINVEYAPAFLNRPPSGPSQGHMRGPSQAGPSQAGPYQGGHPEYGIEIDPSPAPADRSANTSGGGYLAPLPSQGVDGDSEGARLLRHIDDRIRRLRDELAWRERAGRM